MKKFLRWLLAPHPEVINSQAVVGLLPSHEAAPLVAALQHNAGFQHLLACLAIQKAALEKKLSSDWHKDLQEVASLQAGIHWLDFLARQVSTANHKQSRPATTVEADLLKSVYDSIELIGNE
jgi:hypothetical protein